MRRVRLLGALVPLVAYLLAGARLQAATEIEPGIYRLEGWELSLGNEDLEPLARIIDKAEVVALGEAVHTTADFSRAKHRLFAYMVEELGFRVLAFESSWVAAEQVAEYVQSCAGTARKAVEGLFPVWQSAEVRDLANWMCRWNQDNPDDRVYFYGFDIQQSADPFRLRARLISFGIPDGDPLLSGLFECLLNRALASHQTCLETLDDIEAFLDRNETEIVEATSEEDIAWARIHLVGTRAYENMLWYLDGDRRRAFEARDAGMAYVLESIRQIRFPGALTAVWAHNYHIGRGRVLGDRVMGLHLKKAFKRKYRALGLVALEASTDWRPFSCGHFATAESGSVEELLSRLGEPYLLVDLAFPGGSPPFLVPGRRYEINWGWKLVPRHRYNGLIYMRTAEKMRPLAWAPCDS